MKYYVKNIFIILALAMSSIAFCDSNEERDFEAFKYVLGLNEGSASNSSTLNQLALRELSLNGRDPKALYERVGGYLSKLSESLRSLLLIQAKLDRKDYRATSDCFEFGVCFGFIISAIDLKLSVGMSHTPILSFPTFGMKLSVVDASGSNELALGVGAAMGVEKYTSPDSELPLITKSTTTHFPVKEMSEEDAKKAFINAQREKGSAQAGSLGVGIYKVDLKGIELSRGFMAGLFFMDSANSHNMTLKVPLKIPLYYFFYKSDLEKQLLSIVRSLHRFDFASLDFQIEKFQNSVERLKKKFAKRGLVIDAAEIQSQALLGPLSSVANLFHPMTLLRNSPKLLPESLRIESCEESLSAKKGRNSEFLAF